MSLRHPVAVCRVENVHLQQLKGGKVQVQLKSPLVT